MTLDLDQLKKHPGVLRLYNERIRLTKDGKEYLGLCPLHQERTPSFKCFVHEGSWIWKCFGCSKAGSILDLIQQMDNCTLKEAIKTAQAGLGDQSWEEARERVDAVFQPPVAEDEGPKRTLTLRQIAGLERGLENSQPAKDWLKSRGISLDTAKSLHLGFKQDLGRTAFGEKSEIVAGGWLAFPCVEGDTVMGIKFRSIAKKTFRKQPQMATTLYNVDDIDPLEPIYLVEGECDAAILKQAGFRAVSLPSASTTVTPEMRDQLMVADSVILAGDCDGGVGSQIMERLRRDLGDRSYLLKWPDGKKDANQTFLETSKGDVSSFRTLVEQLTVDAKGNPMPEFTSIQKALSGSKQGIAADHPHRLHFPWAGVDKMSILLPGSVLVVSATNSGMGKTQWNNQLAIYSAKHHNEVVVNYQVELSATEIANITAAHVTHRDRNQINQEDNLTAAKMLRGVNYYIGCDPTINTASAALDLLEKAIRRLGATIVILDHIHALCRGDNELRDQAEASRRIKTIAQQYQVKFIVVTQPRKADAKNKGKSIHITDIKGSGAIIDDCDSLLVLHRNIVQNPDPNNPPMDNYESETEVHCLKARAKGTGAAFTKLYFHGALATFTDMTVMEPPPS
jgi:hypothetical protein